MGQMTIELGWWLVPFGFTVIVGVAYWFAREPYARTGFPVDMVYALVCTNVVLAAWLVWAVLT